MNNNKYSIVPIPIVGEKTSYLIFKLQIIRDNKKYECDLQKKEKCVWKEVADWTF